MPITVYPVRIEAYDNTDRSLQFSLEAADECCATLKMETIIAPGEAMEELFQAIREGLSLLNLECN